MLKDINYNPDVLSCLANLSSDEVFTPPELVNKMLDMLPYDIWSDEKITFLDPSSKSGVFLREIVKRLNFGLSEKIPDTQERINHIFQNQVFGIAVTELTAFVSRRTLYCSKHANGKYSLFVNCTTESGNVLFDLTSHEWKGGRCIFCGASKEQYLRDDSLEAYAYKFIHTKTPERIFDMRFDVIVGNPPYQLDTGGSGRQATPLYNKFVKQAKSLNPRYITMIIPSRWFAGGMGLDSFRQEMLNDKRISKIVDFTDARDCFPNVDIAGGVCYFLWDKLHNGETHIINNVKGQEFEGRRSLNEFETFVRLSPAVPILRKILDKKLTDLTTIVSATVPFGLKTSERGSSDGDLTLVSSAGRSRINIKKITSGYAYIRKWKVLTSKASHDHAGQPDTDGKRRVLSKLEILEPNAVCTGSYILLGAFDTEEEAINLKSYAETRVFRFLVSLLSFSQDITRERFRYVPLLDVSEPWNDEKISELFNINKDEFNFICSLIREY
ncbi:Eco57I restriction-modification methylase domain-containing protein [Paracoccaceae bacterium]|nr:Eco57I restriction-modification methylase domain-containing protein [Paracoccaceae bacterium]